jgi:hypothetical protein|tara:strand:+ start:210 stop:341 length:132 start_codon:yes stop_codon:yes gene_type:complete
MMFWKKPTAAPISPDVRQSVGIPVSATKRLNKNLKLGLGKWEI